MLMEKSSFNNIFTSYLCPTGHTDTPQLNNMHMLKMLTKKGSIKFNQVELNVSFLIDDKKVKKVFSLHPCARQGTQTH